MNFIELYFICGMFFNSHGTDNKSKDWKEYEIQINLLKSSVYVMHQQV